MDRTERTSMERWVVGLCALLLVVATYLYDADGLKVAEAEYDGLRTIVWDGAEVLQARYENRAAFVSQSVPTQVPVGASHAFPATFVAPTTPGTYAFQWGLLQEALGAAFGEPSPVLSISVT